MPKRTLLDMTQSILESMDSDSVNSVSDTIEAMQVANTIRRTYFELMAELDLPHKNELVNLEGLGDTSKPTHMRIPEAVQQVFWVKYDTRNSVPGDRTYTDMRYLSPDEFIQHCNARPSTDTTNYQVVAHTANSPIVVGKLQPPAFWTSFDDEYVVFDSYDSSVDSTLQSSKVMSHGAVSPTLSVIDAAVPDLPENLFPLLYAQAEATCHAYFRQTINPKAERSENRLRVRSMRNKWRESRMIDKGPNYGR